MIAADGGHGRVITAQPGHYAQPRFSPDGEQIVYRKLSGGYLLSGEWSSEPGLYLIATAGGEAKKFNSSGFTPHFGADGERVFYLESVDDTQLALKSIDLDGHEERTLLQGAEANEFSVSPDGRWVAFTQNQNACLAPFPITGRKVEIGKDGEAFPVRQVSSRAGENLRWSGDSGTLYWNHAATLYSRALHDAFAFLDGAPEELPEPEESGRNLSFTVKADMPTGTMAITGGRVITMRDADNSEEIIENGVVLIKGNRITAVGTAGEFSALVGQGVRLDHVAFLVGFLTRGHGEKELPLRIPQLLLDDALESRRALAVAFGFGCVPRELGNLLEGFGVGPHVRVE